MQKGPQKVCRSEVPGGCVGVLRSGRERATVAPKSLAPLQQIDPPLPGRTKRISLAHPFDSPILSTIMRFLATHFMSTS
ncbi:hypothetical protein CDAR_539041 [Caerostris darwini]|uniref:Uncharacterized protein n=1 Tax=Caerostris darwini TaxID=1538125 RepID=A0AAV4T2N9_9ARAC|nr:hypothetical protein CDAR_539041 [Caerostris darwini]